jgi:hypothetical protein
VTSDRPQKSVTTDYRLSSAGNRNAPSQISLIRNARAENAIPVTLHPNNTLPDTATIAAKILFSTRALHSLSRAKPLYYPTSARLITGIPTLRASRQYSSNRISKMGKEKIAIIGSGNWGSAIAKIAGQNASEHSDSFEDSRIPMWVFEEEVNGKKLTEIINETHINEKYLPGITLPENIYATPDLDEVVKDATAFIFVLPHQFLGKAIDSLKGKIAPGGKGVTLIKGVDVSGGDIRIFADTIEKELGISCSALSGANIADEGKSIRRKEARQRLTIVFCVSVVAAGKFSGK